jgi:anti-sigma regulatory factor (Ser/Thr protein kinase)
VSRMDVEARVEFSLPALAGNVPLVRHALAGLAEGLGMEPAEIADLKTVVTEACMNVVAHAYEGDETGLLEVDAWPEGECLVIRVRDYGTGIRPLADVEHRSLRLGLPLIAALTRSFELSGEPGRGTEVRMMIPFAATQNGELDAPSANGETKISLPAGELLGPILSRVVSMFATRADFSLDELSDAVLLSDAISAGGPDDFPDRTAKLTVTEQDGSFELRVGPLGEGGARKLLDGMRIPSLDASLEGLADEVRIDPGDGGELLAIRLSRPTGAEPAPLASDP